MLVSKSKILLISLGLFGVTSAITCTSNGLLSSEPCGNTCCEGFFECADPANSLCCLSGYHASDGVCCPKTSTNCAGTCCGGVCQRAIRPLGRFRFPFYQCVYSTDAQCQAVGANGLCNAQGGCPGKFDSCEGSCCYTTNTE